MTIAASALALSGSVAQGATVTFSGTTVQWVDAEGEAIDRGYVGYGGNGTSMATVTWGLPVPPNVKPSAFTFGVASNSIIVDPTTAFTLGTFTHQNNVNYYGLDQIGLRLNTTVAVDGASIGNRIFQYDFFIDETPNIGNCPFGGVGMQCADRVRIGQSPAS
jgi:hypothetical protein